MILNRLDILGSNKVRKSKLMTLDYMTAKLNSMSMHQGASVKAFIFNPNRKNHIFTTLHDHSEKEKKCYFTVIELDEEIINFLKV